MARSILFEQAVIDSKQLPEKPSNEMLLQLYSFYKQATEGDVSGEAPSTLSTLLRKPNMKRGIR